MRKPFTAEAAERAENSSDLTRHARMGGFRNRNLWIPACFVSSAFSAVDVFPAPTHEIFHVWFLAITFLLTNWIRVAICWVRTAARTRCWAAWALSARSRTFGR